jgi:hypothetical protein
LSGFESFQVNAGVQQVRKHKSYTPFEITYENGLYLCSLSIIHFKRNSELIWLHYPNVSFQLVWSERTAIIFRKALGILEINKVLAWNGSIQLLPFRRGYDEKLTVVFIKVMLFWSNCTIVLCKNYF